MNELKKKKKNNTIEGKAVDLAGSGEGCFEVATPNVAGLCIENIGIVRTTRTINTDAPGFYSFFFFFLFFFHFLTLWLIFQHWHSLNNVEPRRLAAVIYRETIGSLCACLPRSRRSPLERLIYIYISIT